MSARFWLYHCHGKSPRTGKPVGERHRWPNGWGRGYCEFCGRTLDQLRYLAPAQPRNRGK